MHINCLPFQAALDFATRRDAIAFVLPQYALALPLSVDLGGLDFSTRMKRLYTGHTGKAEVVRRLNWQRVAWEPDPVTCAKGRPDRRAS